MATRKQAPKMLSLFLLQNASVSQLSLLFAYFSPPAAQEETVKVNGSAS